MHPLLTEEDAEISYADHLKAYLTEEGEIKEAYDACHRELYFQAGDLLLVWKPFPRSGKIRKASLALATPAPVNYESFHEATMEWHSPQALVSGSAETASEKGQQKIKNNIRGTRSTCLDRSTTSD
ncbi:hypothetical protein OUZ56_029687 [Daphnia magna]|uniref:Uncharacterized protein n=1 Tax=Daphnia magna TaxID=35525 RepID=A0ABR0B7N9_9CRUS|nr:hypothetical protein OUZ56_029687 [Daphnia magna]